MGADYKGLVLAAGFGTRLRPLTEVYPKPLIPFMGTTPLALAIDALSKVGISDIAVNAHYLASKVEEFVNLHQKSTSKTNLHYSYEPEILGTGGALNPLRQWLGDANLVILNGDVVSTIDVAALLRKHEERKAAASMVLLPQVIPGESSVFHRDGLVRAISKVQDTPGVTAGNFACAQVLTPSFIDLMPRTGSFDVVSKGYQPALAGGLPIASMVHTGFWHDLRSPHYYWQSLVELLNRPTFAAQLGVHKLIGVNPNSELITNHRTFIHPTAQLDGSCEIGPFAIIESGCEIGSGAIIRDSLILPDTKVMPGESIQRLIIGPNVRIPIDC